MINDLKYMFLSSFDVPFDLNVTLLLLIIITELLLLLHPWNMQL